MDIENVTVNWYQDGVLELNCNICDQYINKEDITSIAKLNELVALAENHRCTR